MPDRRLLGLDPATRTGFCWSDGHTRAFGIWELHGTPDEKFAELRELLIRFHRTEPYNELVYEAGSQVNRYRKVVAFQLGMETVIRQTATDLGVKLLDPLNPKTVKKWLTGSGSADKAQIVAAIETHFGLEIPLHHHDAADACAVCEAAWAGVKPPKVQRKEGKRREKAARKKQAVLFPMGKVRQVRRA